MRELQGDDRRPFFTASVYAWTATLLSVHAVICLAALPVTLVVDRRRRFAARLGGRLTRFGLSLASDWRPVARRLGEVRLDEPTIVVMNHRSLADIALAVAVAGGPKIVSKPWAGRLPLVGLCMRLCGHVIFDPASPRSVRDMMERLERGLRRGDSVLFFPEGTRRSEAGLGEFHEGAFRLAERTGARVLPIVLHGMGELVPRGAFAFRDVHVDVAPLTPVAPTGGRGETARRVRDAMSAALAARADG
jgi:1-acyl-sn-glycerol-3-phosphate acyltransferase